MAKKAQAKEKVYNFVQFFRCEKCETEVIHARPCEKCENLTFNSYYKVVERK